MHFRISMEIIKTRDLGHTGWLSGFMMCGKPARKVLRSACLLIGVSIHRLPMHCSGQDGSGEEQRCGIRETPVHRKAVSASRLNTLCGAVTDRCRSTVRYLVWPGVSDMESAEPDSCDRETVAAYERCHPRFVEPRGVDPGPVWPEQEQLSLQRL